MQGNSDPLEVPTRGSYLDPIRRDMRSLWQFDSKSCLHFFAKFIVFFFADVITVEQISKVVMYRGLFILKQ